MSKFGLILMDNVNFDYVLIKILKKERHFLHTVFCKDFESAIRLTNFQFWKFDLIWQYDLRNVAVVDGNIDLRPFLAADLDSWGQNWFSMGWTVRSQNLDLILRFFNIITEIHQVRFHAIKDKQGQHLLVACGRQH